MLVVLDGRGGGVGVEGGGSRCVSGPRREC